MDAEGVSEDYDQYEPPQEYYDEPAWGGDREATPPEIDE